MDTQDLTPTQRTLRWRDFFFAPLGCFLSIPPIIVIGGLLTVLLVGAYLYYNVNIEIFSLGHPPYDQMQINRTWEQVTLGDRSWALEYEGYQPVSFQGLVRFIGPIRQHGIPFLTHDVLITSGDFANAGMVDTSVVNHTFRWVSRQTAHPQGTINLLHTVPQQESLYQQLIALRNGQHVRVAGYEILRIDAYDPKGNVALWWQDSGCNSLLVTKIDVLTP